MYPDYGAIVLFGQNKLALPALLARVDEGLTEAFSSGKYDALKLRSKGPAQVLDIKIACARKVATQLSSLIACKIQPADAIRLKELSWENLSQLLFFIINDRLVLNMAFKEYFVKRPAHMSNNQNLMPYFTYVSDTWNNWLDRFEALPETQPMLLLARVPPAGTVPFSWSHLGSSVYLWCLGVIDRILRVWKSLKSNFKTKKS